SRPSTPQAAFAHLALAFRCDVFTLRQRLQVEKRARDAAEENIQEELGQCRAALERLERLQPRLAVLAAAVERATSAAEKLGAVHQVMVQHVENLKRHHMREHAELEEMKRLIQQNSRNRQLAETQDDAEPRLRPHPVMRTFQQGSARRRVSIAVIPKQLLVQGVPSGAVAAMALPPAALLGFLLAASPEHRLPPPRPCPGAAAAAACSITQGLA
ncbi:Lymphoid-restricted membrane protein, partial [Cathartes aura]